MKKISKLFAMIFFVCTLAFGICACSSSAGYDNDDAEQISLNENDRSVGFCQRYGE